MKTTKRALCLLLVLATLCSLCVSSAGAASAAPYADLSTSRYATVYTLATSGKAIPYTTADLTQRGSEGRPSGTAYIDCKNDDLRLFAVGVNSSGKWWAWVSYPITGTNTRRTAYIHLSDITANTHAVKTTATGKFCCAPRKGWGIDSRYYVAKGDTVYLLALSEDGSQVQIKYPVSNGRFRIAWAPRADYEKYCGPVSNNSSGSTTQKSPIIEEGDYYYIASALDTGKVLDVKNGSNKDGANIQLYKKNATDAQLFRFIKSSREGYYYIINKGSGKAIDVQGGATASGTNVQQYTRNNTQAQRWKIQFFSGSSGNVTIQAQCGKYLDVCNAGTKNGTNIWIYDGNGTKAQQFVLIPYVSRSYKTVTLEFHDIQSWMDAVSKAQRSVCAIGSMRTNPSGNTYYTGQLIIGAEVLEYKRLTVKVPAMGPGAYEKKTIDFPSKIRYKLHSHETKIHCWFTVSELQFWQNCECGYHDEWAWEVPWPDLTKDTDTQTTSKVIDSIQPVWRNLYNVN